MSALDRYTTHPDWIAYRDAHMGNYAAGHGGMTAETQILIQFAGLVDNGQSTKPQPATRPAPQPKPAAPRPAAGAKAGSGYVSWRALEKHVMPMIAKALNPLFEAAAAALHRHKAHIDALEKQLAVLTAELTTIKANGLMQYRDVWGAAVSYRAGDAVTSGGCLWVCKHDCVGVRPGNGSELWRLAVKRGRDARDDRREQRDVPA